MAQASSKSKKPAPVNDNFLEALRDLSKGVVDDARTQLHQAVTSDVRSSFGLDSSGTLNPNEQVSINQLQKAEA